MARTFVQQDTQIYNSNVYTDNVAPTEAAFETNPANLETDLTNIRSQLHNLLQDQAGNWWDDLNVPSALETGAQRGVNDLNTALHAVEKKRVLREVHNLTDVTVGGTDDFVILGTGELPAQTTAAVGTVTTLGTVVAAHGGTFGTHALTEVTGNNAVNPQNLCEIVDGATRDPILSGGAKIYGLLQGESGVTDGATITDATTTRVQISFVKVNGTGDDLIAVPAADIQGLTINYCTRERVRLEDLNEQDFLTGAIVDVGAGAGTIDRQTAYTNQGATIVTTAAAATLDLGTGLTWEIGDDDSAALFTITEGSAGSNTTLAIGAEVDVYDNDAASNDFLQGITVDSGATRTITIGVNEGLVETTSGDLEVKAAGELILNDTNMVTEGTWTGPGVKVSDTTAEVTAYETTFGGEVSLMNALVQAANTTLHTKVQAVVTANISADSDASGPANDNNLDTDLGDLSSGTFVTDYDIFVNGILQRNGANAAANEDVYPGTALANGQLRFEYALKGTGNADVVTVIQWA